MPAPAPNRLPGLTLVGAAFLPRLPRRQKIDHPHHLARQHRIDGATGPVATAHSRTGMFTPILRSGLPVCRPNSGAGVSPVSSHRPLKSQISDLPSPQLATHHHRAHQFPPHCSGGLRPPVVPARIVERASCPPFHAPAPAAFPDAPSNGRPSSSRPHSGAGVSPVSSHRLPKVSTRLVSLAPPILPPPTPPARSPRDGNEPQSLHDSPQSVSQSSWRSQIGHWVAHATPCSYPSGGVHTSIFVPERTAWTRMAVRWEHQATGCCVDNSGRLGSLNSLDERCCVVVFCPYAGEAKRLASRLRFLCHFFQILRGTLMFNSSRRAGRSEQGATLPSSSLIPSCRKGQTTHDSCKRLVP